MTRKECIEYVKNLNFKEFDLRKQFDGRRNLSCVIAGKRRLGKTHLLNWLLHSIKDWYSEVYIFSETLELQPTNFDFGYPNNKYNKFDEGALEDIWNKQKNYILDYTKNGSKKESLNYICVIFDDVINDSNIRSSPMFNSFHTQGRHINLACFSITQTISTKWGFNSLILQNLDLFISFQLKNLYCRESLVERFLSNRNKNEGHEILNSITNEAYKAIVIDNTAISSTYEDFIYTIKAPAKNPPKFKIGLPTSQALVHKAKPRLKKGPNGKKKMVQPIIKYNIEVSEYEPLKVILH